MQEDVEEWLYKLGLEDYWGKFKESSYTSSRDLADLKFMDVETLKKTFGIFKEGHLMKMMNAIEKLQYPTQGRDFLYTYALSFHKMLPVSVFY